MTTGSEIDIWSGAGPPAHPSKRFRSLHVSVGRSPSGITYIGNGQMVVVSLGGPDVCVESSNHFRRRGF
jgi:hypothetical protein